MSRLELSIFADYFQFYVEDDVRAPEMVDFTAMTVTASCCGRRPSLWSHE